MAKTKKKTTKKKTTKKPRTGKHPGGRPTKYKAEYSTPAYLNKFIAHCKRNKRLISICQLAVYIRVTEETLQSWGKKKPEFLRSLGEIKQLCKNDLVNGGLNGTYNSNITKMLLSANHGTSERQQIEHSGEVTLKPPVIE